MENRHGEGIAPGMNPLFIEGKRRLFANYHASEPSARKHRGVMLCNPFGQEALRAHRLYRVLAERLARAGVDVLRFDYYGTGDSYGDDREGELRGWTQDLLTAHEELLKLSSTHAVTWVGIRLGATLAMQCALDARDTLDHLVLVDPIVNGAKYSRQLRQLHVQRLEQVFRRPKSDWRQELAADANAFPDETAGFGLAPEFHAQLAGISANGSSLTGVPRATVLFDAHDEEIARWRAADGQSGYVKWICANHGYDWSAHDTPDGTLLPARVMNELMAILVDR
jgi:pimeloyl-ACP methyl ester carboxylesterase